MISKRIQELADMVPETERVIDVGCDHALLDVYLTSKLKKTKFLATDISNNAINNAINTIKNNHLESKIDTLVTDGLNNIDLNKNDFIVISGMGTNTIIDIISPKIKQITNILIQSNRDLELLRKFMFENGYKIKEEKVIFDELYYVFIYFTKGKYKYCDIDLWLGPITKKSNNKAYFEFLVKKYKKILPGIPDNDLKKKNIINRIKKLNNLIEKM